MRGCRRGQKSCTRSRDQVMRVATEQPWTQCDQERVPEILDRVKEQISLNSERVSGKMESHDDLSKPFFQEYYKIIVYNYFKKMYTFFHFLCGYCCQKTWIGRLSVKYGEICPFPGNFCSRYSVNMGKSILVMVFIWTCQKITPSRSK